jgi:hypothetical protein
VEKHGVLGHGGDHALLPGAAQEFVELVDAVEDHTAGA